MSEYEPQPQDYEFPWLQDEDGDYLVIRSDEVDRFEVRRQTSFMFLYMGNLAMYNHIWIEMPEMGETEETVMGVRMWQKSFDDKFGEGAFIALCDQMDDRGFAMADEDEPSELDRQAFHATFTDTPPPEEVEEDAIVLSAMRNFDKEWVYYAGEPGWS